MARYDRAVPPSAAELGAARADVDTCVEAMRAGASRQSRTRATWLPASLVAPWSAGAMARQRAGSVRYDEPGVDRAI